MVVDMNLFSLTTNYLRSDITAGLKLSVKVKLTLHNEKFNTCVAAEGERANERAIGVVDDGVFSWYIKTGNIQNHLH